MKEGFSNLFKENHSSYSSNDITNKQSPSGLIPVRVLDIILDENHPRFKELGGYSSIGTIIFQTLGSPINNPNDNFNYALPLFPNNKQLPLINEVVLIININVEGNNVGNKSKYYYFGSINLWNTPHHNALPNERKDLNNNIDSEGNINLNFTSDYYEGEFNEKGNLNPLQHYPGDIIYEGRNGNSIRLGSTYKSNNNEWSNHGENGDPILILRNGPYKENNKESWIPINESINNDISNIYLTSNQRIPIKYTSNFSSLKTKPLEPNIYSDPQIILNSDRIILKSKNDGILINGGKFLHLSSNNHIGINSEYTISFNSNLINLGGVDSKESSVLGDKLMDSLSKLTETISNLVDILSDMSDWHGGSPTPSPIGSMVGLLKPEINNLKNLYENKTLLSKIVKLN